MAGAGGDTWARFLRVVITKDRETHMALLEQLEVAGTPDLLQAGAMGFYGAGARSSPSRGESMKESVFSDTGSEVSESARACSYYLS